MKVKRLSPIAKKAENRRISLESVMAKDIYTMVSRITMINNPKDSIVLIIVLIYLVRHDSGIVNTIE